MLNLQVIRAALGGVCLDQLHATHFGRLKPHLHGILSILEFTRAGLHRHRCGVVGEAAVDQTGLAEVAVCARIIEQHHSLGRSGLVEILQQFNMLERAALAVKDQAHHVGGQHHILTRNGRSNCRLASRAGHRAGTGGSG